jgi:hypothetical protein
MKHLGSTEKVVLLLAGSFIIFGAYSAIYPSETYLPHPSSTPYRSLIGQDPPPEHVSREKARVYGIISIGFGIGLGWLVLYRPHK